MSDVMRLIIDKGTVELSPDKVYLTDTYPVYRYSDVLFPNNPFIDAASTEIAYQSGMMPFPAPDSFFEHYVGNWFYVSDILYRAMSDAEYGHDSNGYYVYAVTENSETNNNVDNPYYDAVDSYPITDVDNFCIDHKIDGNDVLSFRISTNCDTYRHIQEERRIEYGKNRWIIKKIKDGKVECLIDFDFLKTTVYKNFLSNSATLAEVLEAHLPSDWTVQNAGVVTIHRTIEFDFCTDYDVVMKCMDTYGVYLVWETLRKTVIVYSDVAMESTGEYLTDELNLKNVAYKGSTNDFITRLYAYGAEKMSMVDALVDDGHGGQTAYGLEYVDNNTYSDKIICGYWFDERYTNADTLKKDAEDRLSSLAYPVRSYDCDVIDIAKCNPDYSFLDIKMHKKLTLVDTARSVKVVHQVVEYKEYPNEPVRNKVILSCVPGTIMATVNRSTSSISSEIERNNMWVNERVAQVTAILATALGGHVYKTDSEIYIMDTNDPDTALNVWRWNVNGFGHSSTGIGGPYSMAMTYDNQFIADIIRAVVIRGELIEANSIAAEQINQTYTDGVLTQAFSSAKGIVASSIETVMNYLTNAGGDGQLDIIKSQMSMLTQTVAQITAQMTDRYQGGVNFVRNSAGLNGVSRDWSYTGTVDTMQSSDTKNYTVSNSCFRLSRYATLSQVLNDIVIGKTYTVSAKIKKTVSSVNGYLKVKYNGTAEVYLVNTQESYGWTEYSAIIEDVADGSMTVEMYTGGDYLYVSDIMVAEGRDKKAWSPAPNEIYTEEVKIDRHGVTVSNNESDTKTVVNNVEFAVYHNDSKVITVNKDETHLKKSIVEEDLTIGKVKCLPLENPNEGCNIVILS